MSLKEHWDHGKSFVLWSIILILSLRVYGSCLDQDAREKARKSWQNRKMKILEFAETMACSDQYKKVEFQKVLEDIRASYIDKALDLENDSDFRFLTNQEQQNFFDDVRQRALWAWDACQNEAPPTTSIS